MKRTDIDRAIACGQATAAWARKFYRDPLVLAEWRDEQIAKAEAARQRGAEADAQMYQAASM